MNHLHLGSWLFPQPHVGFLWKSAKILAAQSAPLVSTTPGGKLTASVVDTVSKFTAGVTDTGGHTFSRDLHWSRCHLGQNLSPMSNGTSVQQRHFLADCLLIKLNCTLSKKILSKRVNCYPKVSIQNETIILFKHFSQLPPVSMKLGVHLVLELRNNFEN